MSPTRTMLLAALCLCATSPAAGTDEPAEDLGRKKIVLIVGPRSHGPVGDGIHDYPWSVKLLKVMLDNSNVAGRVRVECHLDGWPVDQATFDDADAILVVSDGRNDNLYAEAPHFASEEHARVIEKQVARPRLRVPHVPFLDLRAGRLRRPDPRLERRVLRLGDRREAAVVLQD